MGYEFEEYATINGIEVDAYATNGEEELIFLVPLKDEVRTNKIVIKHRTLVNKFPNARIILSPALEPNRKEISFNNMMAVKPYAGNLENFVIPVNNFTSLQWEKLERMPVDDVEPNDIQKYVDLNHLNNIIKEWIGTQEYDIDNFSIHKLIEEDEIGGSLYKVLPEFATKHSVLEKEHFILHLDCDSDYYSMTLCLYIDLFSGETFINDM
jgi:hypothetical protein